MTGAVWAAHHGWRPVDLIMNNGTRPNYRVKIEISPLGGRGHDHALDLVGAFVDLVPS
jgi:hypothetical protein